MCTKIIKWTIFYSGKFDLASNIGTEIILFIKDLTMSTLLNVNTGKVNTPSYSNISLGTKFRKVNSNKI